MKAKVSVSLSEETITEIERALSKSIFRNKSHLIEHAIQKFLGERKQ